LGERSNGLDLDGDFLLNNFMAKVKTATLEKPEILNGVNRGSVDPSIPYIVTIEMTGSCPIIFHRWSCEDVASKAAAKKGSKEKKSDNIEGYVYRDEDGHVCIPGEYLRMSLCMAAKFKQDPRSPRKSAFDLFKAGIVPLTELAKINGGTKDWDFLDQRRVVIQRNSITRMRPAFLKGWSAEVDLLVNTPEYIDYTLFSEVLSMSGRLIGLGDFRPTYGRFDITKCKIKNLD
jgi:hypothetical protein